MKPDTKKIADELVHLVERYFYENVPCWVGVGKIDVIFQLPIAIADIAIVAEVKPALCPCGITRQDCEYHRGQS